MNSKVSAYYQLMRLDRPIGTLLLLWPTLWGLWLTGSPSVYLVSVFVLGVFLMRAAGCVINDFADRKFDGHVLRTQNRPLASGRLTAKNALVLFTILVILSALLLLTLPPLAWLIAVFALATAVIYPFMKRFTHLPQLILGIAFSWGIPMTYAATTGQFPITCWLLFFVNIVWTVAYDTQYAMVDRDDDLKIGIKSTAILFGQFDKLVIAGLQLIVVLILLIVGVLNNLSWVFYLTIIITVGLFIYQQWLIKDRHRQYCFKAFLNNNYVGMVIFIGIVIGWLM